MKEYKDKDGTVIRVSKVRRVEVDNEDIVVKKPAAKLIGEDGNIFNLISIASRALTKAGLQRYVEKMRYRIDVEAEDYDHALRIIEEYVEIV